MRIFNDKTKIVHISTLFVAEQPNYKNFSYVVTGLDPSLKYAFNYKASNIYGDSDFTPLQYFTPGEFPVVVGLPHVITFEDYVVINWGPAFTSYYLFEITNFEVYFLSSSNNWY
jgi:hypothetical protein